MYLFFPSFLITISHFLLYVPTMLVIGLHGWFLHPIAILLCDMIVYSEFLIHPVVLLSTSTKLRQEIKQTLQRLCQDIISVSKVQSCSCLACCMQTSTFTSEKRHHIYAVANKSPPLKINSTSPSKSLINLSHILLCAFYLSVQ